MGQWVWLAGITEVSGCHCKDIILQVGGREGFPVRVITIIQKNETMFKGGSRQNLHLASYPRR